MLLVRSAFWTHVVSLGHFFSDGWGVDGPHEYDRGDILELPHLVARQLVAAGKCVYLSSCN
jgi:hypothetical protein